MTIGYSPKSLQVMQCPRQDSNLRHLFRRPVIRVAPAFLSTLRLPIQCLQPSRGLDPAELDFWVRFGDCWSSNDRDLWMTSTAG
jgi:hypothetical protein